MAIPLSIFDGLFKLGATLIDKLIQDPSEKAEAKYKLIELAQNGELQTLAAEVELAKGQMAINAEEAKSDSTFKGGWRPFIGWVCGVACAWNWIGLNIALFIAKLNGNVIDMAPLDLTEMMPILLGMLGLGTLRTYERVNGAIPKGK